MTLSPPRYPLELQASIHLNLACGSLVIERSDSLEIRNPMVQGIIVLTAGRVSDIRTKASGWAITISGPPHFFF